MSMSRTQFSIFKHVVENYIIYECQWFCQFDLPVLNNQIFNYWMSIKIKVYWQTNKTIKLWQIFVKIGSILCNHELIQPILMQNKEPPKRTILVSIYSIIYQPTKQEPASKSFLWKSMILSHLLLIRLKKLSSIPAHV